jgi:hypothetical protein
MWKLLEEAAFLRTSMVEKNQRIFNWNNAIINTLCKELAIRRELTKPSAPLTYI